MAEPKSFFESLLENSENGLIYYKIIFDKKEKASDYRIIDVNPAFGKLIGFKVKDLIGKNISKILPRIKKDHSFWNTFFDETMKHKNCGSLELFSSNVRKWYHVLVYKPQKENILTIFIECSKQKQTEKELHSALLYSRSLLEASLDPLVTINPDGKITDVNKATENVTGILREKLIGNDFSDFFTEPRKASEGYQKVLKEGLVRNYPLTIRHASGKTTDVLYNATMYKNETGGIEGVFAAARDITDMKEAEARANEAYKFYRMIFENTEDGLLLSSPDGRIFDSNPAATRILGFSREEFIKIGREGVVDMSDARVLSFLEKRLKDGFVSGELTLLCKDGTKKSGEISSRIFFNEKGEAFTSLIFRDITERKKMQEAIIKSEKELRTIFEILPVGVSILNEKREIINSNPALENILGINRDGISKGRYKSWRYLRGDLLPMTEDEFPSKIAIDEKAAIQNTEVGVIRENGDLVWTSISAAPLTESDIVVVTTDITERKNAEKKIKESEASLKEAQHMAKIGSYRYEIDSGIITWSDEMYNLLGRDKQSGTPAYEELSKYYSAESWGLHKEMVDRAIKNGESYNVEFEIIRSDSQEKGWLNITGKVEKDDTGKMIALFGTAQDITERKIISENLRKLNDEILDLYSNAPCGYHSLDENGLFIRINDTELKWLGYKKDEVVGVLNISDILTPESLKKFNASFKVFKKNGFIDNLELEYVRKDGSTFFVNLNATAVKDEKGRFKYSRTTLFDITDRKRAEKQIVHDASFPQFNPNPVIEVDFSGSITYCNPMAEGLFKKIGLDDARAFLPDDINEIIKTMGRDKPGPINREVSIKGNYFEESICFAPGFDTIRIYGRDITNKKRGEAALKKSEIELKEAQHIAQLGSWSWNSKMDIITWSDELYRVFNRDPKLSTPKYEEHLKLYTKESAMRLDSAVKNSFQTGASYELDLELASTIQPKKWVTARGEVILDPDGNIIGLHGTAQDITTRKRLEEQLRELANHLRLVREEERTSISRALHDNFGQSLTGLKMEISSLEKKLSKITNLIDNKEIFDKFNSMKTILDDAVKLTGRLSMELRPNILDMLGIKSAIEWLVKDFKAKSGIDSKLTSGIETLNLNQKHSTEVFRIIQEALTNIVRHAKASRVDINIFIDNNNYVIEVKDNGIGINREDITSPYSVGIIGMRERALLFGGNIEIESKKKKGTKVSITIPIK